MDEGGGQAQRVSALLGGGESPTRPVPRSLWVAEEPEPKAAQHEAGDSGVKAIRLRAELDRLLVDLFQELREELDRYAEVRLPEFGPATRQLCSEAELGHLVALSDPCEFVDGPLGPVELDSDHLRVPHRVDDLEELPHLSHVRAELVRALVVLSHLR